MQRDSALGAVTIANLRCTARKLNLDGEGNAPDGFRPGLFITEGTVSEQLSLLDDGRIFFQPGQHNYYRFGAVDGHPRDITKDGIHFSSGENNNLNSVRLRVSRDHPTLVLTGTKDGNVPCILVQNAEDPPEPLFSVTSDGDINAGGVDCAEVATMRLGLYSHNAVKEEVLTCTRTPSNVRTFTLYNTGEMEFSQLRE